MRSRYFCLACLPVLLAAVFFLPYAVPVAPSVSLSYLVGYNNHAAFLIFALGSVLFALLCRDHFPEATSSDQPLGFPSLVLALIIAFACCAFRLLPLSQHHVGGEAQYAINRIQMLTQGLRPYRDFEFAYGPAHLYIPVGFARLTHGSVLHGYYAWWILQWFLGTAMLWAAIRLLQLPLPHRRIVFWVFFVIQLPSMIAEGTAYTPTRGIGSVFFIVLIALLYRKGTKPLLMAGTGIVCVAGALSISPEQGIAVAAGLIVWFSLLIASGQGALKIWHGTIFFCGTAVVMLWCWRMGEFSTLIAFAKGAYSFPLLPSPTNIIILAGYVAAAYAGVHAFFNRRFDSIALPMFISGFALLPAAVGRCDYGHLMMATPALLLGVAVIDARPTLRIWWLPLAVILVVIPALIAPLYLLRESRLQSRTLASAKQPSALSLDPASFAHHPCSVIYRSLNIAPVLEAPLQDCLDTGRYYLLMNAFTSQGIDTVLRGLDQLPLHPLVLKDLPLAEQLQPIDAPLSDLRIYECSLWLPQPRNPPFTYRKIQSYIERNYTPSRTSVRGFRIWYPRN